MHGAWFQIARIVHTLLNGGVRQAARVLGAHVYMALMVWVQLILRKASLLRTFIFASAVVTGFKEAAALQHVGELVRGTLIRMIQVMTS